MTDNDEILDVLRHIRNGQKEALRFSKEAVMAQQALQKRLMIAVSLAIGLLAFGELSAWIAAGGGSTYDVRETTKSIVVG